MKKMKATCHLDQIEIGAENGIIAVRLIKRICSPSGETMSKSYHRTTIPPGVNVDILFFEVNKHLQRMGYEPVSPEDIAKIKEAMDKPEISKVRREKFLEMQRETAERLQADATRHNKLVDASNAAKKAKKKQAKKAKKKQAN